MAAIAKTVVATGVSSGLGLEAVKQLLQQSQSYRIILGARNISATEKAYDEINYDKSASSVTVLPLELSNLKDVKRFASETLEKLGQNKLDLLLLNAGLNKSAEGPGPHGSQWCEALIVNHTSQHYLLHLLRDRLVQDRSRIVVVSSGAIRNVPDTTQMDTDLKADSGARGFTTYCQSKFAQLLGAQWWRRELLETNDVVATSPGMIAGTGLGRHQKDLLIDAKNPDVKSIPEGASNILRACHVTDLPEDPERMFITSWGEWWEKDVYKQALDKALQEKWCPSKAEIEKEAGIA